MAGRGRLRRGFVVTAAVIATLVLVVMTVAMLLLPAASPRRLVTGALEAGDPSFYAVPTSTPAAPPGRWSGRRSCSRAPDGSRAWRVLYHSTDLAGRDTGLSGIVVAPDSPAPATGRVVVGWGHPTTGAAGSCAPSNGVDPYLLVEGLPDLIRAGYVVVAPDYPGMGVPAPSSYLIGTSESRSLLDAVRAARRLPTGATTTTVLWGHSQGGHAVLFAALQAGAHAPELTVRAAAVAAPAADLGTLLDDDIGDVSGGTIGSYAFAAYQQAYAAQYPGLELTSILTDPGAAVTPTMAGLCLFGDNDKLHALATPLLGNYLRSDPRTTEPWSAILTENTSGAPPAGLPVFVAQGGADTLVIRQCDRGLRRGVVPCGCANDLPPVPDRHPRDDRQHRDARRADVLGEGGWPALPRPAPVEASGYVAVKIQQRCRRESIRPYPGRVPRSGAVSSRGHAVMFYDHAQHAVDQLADYVAEGLCAGEAVVTVLMPAHADSLETALRERGVDAERDQDEGRLFLLDAGETLSTFLVDGVPDRDLFAQGVGTLLSGLNESGRRVRAAGEMVALLWAEGNVTAALALEAAWNRLADDLDFDLLCPYPSTVLDDGPLDVVGHLCALHTDVVAPETYASGPDRVVAHGLTTGVFVPAPEAVGATRRLVALALADWSAHRDRRLDELTVADACLVASEMAANAVTHARSAFEVTVTCSEDAVRISVSDVGPGTAEEHHGRLLDLGGRGLAIVADVADHWGCETVPGGKVVWAELVTRQPVTL